MELSESLLGIHSSFDGAVVLLDETRGRGCNRSQRALQNGRPAASASRLADNEKSIIEPAESIAR
jgi:hypothetical protein